jgi:hypothetical protein
MIRCKADGSPILPDEPVRHLRLFDRLTRMSDGEEDLGQQTKLLRPSEQQLCIVKRDGLAHTLVKDTLRSGLDTDIHVVATRISHDRQEPLVYGTDADLALPRDLETTADQLVTEA